MKKIARPGFVPSEIMADLLQKGLGIMLHEEELDFASTRIGNNRIIDSTNESVGGALITTVTPLGQVSYNGNYKMVWLDDPNTSFIDAFMIAGQSPHQEWVTGVPRLRHQHINGPKRRLSTDQRINILADFVNTVDDPKALASGTCGSMWYDFDIRSSANGLNAVPVQCSGSQSYLSMAITDKANQIEAFVASVGRSGADLKVKQLAREAKRHFDLQSNLPLVDIPPGEYPVVMEGYGLSQLLWMLNFVGFAGARAQKGMGCFRTSDLERMVVGENITIRDNPFHPDNKGGVPMPFWCDHIQGRRPFIEDGVLKGHWYLLFDAQKYGQECTGFPENLVMSPGNGPETEEAAMNALGNGIYVRNLFYMRSEDDIQGAMTCMTRFGTYLVKGGKPVARLPNLRVSDSIPRLLSNVEWLSKNRVNVSEEEHYGLSPRMTYLLPRFTQFRSLNITGSTPIEQHGTPLGSLVSIL